MKHPEDTEVTSLPVLLDPIGEILNTIWQPQLPGFLDPVALHLATLGEMLHAHNGDYELMLDLEKLRRYEDDVEEELRDPDSALNQGCCVIVGERSRPTARSLIP